MAKKSKKKNKKTKKAKKNKKKTKGVRIKIEKQKKAKNKKGIGIVYLGLGSNVGDREEYIEQAIFLLGKNSHITVTKHSGNYETAPEGGANQPPFINTTLEIRTKLSAQKLLDVCQEIETTLGREREIEWGPRTCDIDILLYDDQVISGGKLQIPHPLMHERLFILKPLREIAPNAIHPILEKSIAALYEARKAELGEKYDDELPGFKEIKGGGYDDYERW
ncbi:MAG: 2-amino-4-hydroxy-6-hydroxymethyldihydropteridine diphosphokinase [Candidatus Saganbacteria bacterium]|nr:2-amino-4-hydroxy-6-hydroxymethyldihydropteridine diphosphokinase [Candidatus Saganbacteria bacterium]